MTASSVAAVLTGGVGYSVHAELPISLLVFTVPAIVVSVALWQYSRV